MTDFTGISISQRRADASEWTSENPTLPDGQLGFETDTKRYKMGDGSTAWTSLPYRDIPPIVAAGSPTTTASTPEAMGQYYFDTTSNRIYIAEGTSTPADFTLVEVASSNPSFTGTNNTGDTIDKGQPVSGREAVLAVVDSDTDTTFPAVGIAGEDIADSASGTVITYGVLTGLDTDTPGWSVGDPLYVSSDPTTDLGMTSTAPTTGTIQQVAVVMTVDSATGTILVCPQIVADATITEEVYIAATAFTADTTGGPEATTVDYSTNGRTRSVLAFDATTSEEATVEIAMPTGWDEGTITFIPYWSHPSTTTNFGVVWELSALCVGNDDSLDVAFSGTAQTSTDTGGTTDDLYIGPESSGITVQNAAEAELVTLEIARLPANGSDTLAVDARLHGIKVRFTRNAVSDA